MAYTMTLSQNYLSHRDMTVTPPPEPLYHDRVTSTEKLTDTLNASVSPRYLKSANDNSVLLAELNKRIQNNPFVQAATQAQVLQLVAPANEIILHPDIVALAQQDALLAPAETGSEITVASSVVSPLELEQIKLAETVTFLQEMRQAKLLSSKAEVRTFLNFAVAQSALALVENAAPDATALSPDDLTGLNATPANDTAAEAQNAPQPLLNAAALNPLALQNLAARYDKIMPHLATQSQAQTEASPQIIYKLNAEMTIVQPAVEAAPDAALNIAPQVLPTAQPAPVVAALPQTVQAELHAIAVDSQFDVGLVQQAQQALQRVEPAPKLGLKEHDVMVLIATAKEQKIETLGERLNSVEYAPDYHIAVFDNVTQSQKVAVKSIERTHIKVDARALLFHDNNVSLTDQNRAPEMVAQQAKQQREDMIHDMGRKLIGRQFSDLNYQVCVLDHKHDVITRDLEQDRGLRDDQRRKATSDHTLKEGLNYHIPHAVTSTGSAFNVKFAHA